MLPFWKGFFVIVLFFSAVSPSVWGGEAAIPVDDEASFSSSIYGNWEPETVVAPRARVPKTGVTTSYIGRDDGYLRRGVGWPVPRFTDNGNGIVRDNLTGLIWLKDAGCEKFYASDTTGHNNRDFRHAMSAANNLADGYCGLTDGSVAKDWRLPNVREMHSLVDYGVSGPALSNAAGTGRWTEGDAFLNMMSGHQYWSSTSVDIFLAWIIDLGNGMITLETKAHGDISVWPVR